MKKIMKMLEITPFVMMGVFFIVALMGFLNINIFYINIVYTIGMIIGATTIIIYFIARIILTNKDINKI